MRERDGSAPRKGSPMSAFRSDPLPGPWEPVRRHRTVEARLLAAMLACRERLLQWYPRVTVPTLDAEVRTPVAAVLLVWERWDYASGPCPRCGELAVATSFGGVMSIGSVSGCCTACAGVVTREGRGLSWVKGCCDQATAGTPYRMPFRMFPGGWTLRGEPRELVAVLHELGATGVPDATSRAFRRK
jgi:hypothetical protein